MMELPKCANHECSFNDRENCHQYKSIDKCDVAVNLVVPVGPVAKPVVEKQPKLVKKEAKPKKRMW